MPDEMDVSIVIVSWNTRDLLRGCLRSLEEHSGDLRTEVLVVDNGSSDGSPEMVRNEFSAVRLVRNESNRGFARAANQGMREANGRHSLLLNPDTRMLPDALWKMVAFLDEDAKAAVCGPQLVFEDGRPQNSVAPFPTLATELLNKSLLRLLFPRRFPQKEVGGREPREVESVIGAAMMVKAAAAREVGLLDEEYFLFLEETDWCLRFRKAGWKVYQFPAVRVVHFQGKSAKRAHAGARIEYSRSRYVYFRKHHGPLANVVLRAVVPLRVLANVLGNGIGSLFGLLPGRCAERFRVYGAVLRWHLAGCPADGGLQGGGGDRVDQAAGN